MNDIFNNIFTKYEERTVNGYQEKVQDLFKDLETYSYESLIEFIFNKLYWDLEDNEIDTAKENINSLLSINILEYIELPSIYFFPSTAW